MRSIMFVYNLLMDTDSMNKSKVRKRKAALNVSFCVKKERNTVYQKVSNILRKPLAERSNDEIEFLNNSEDIVQQISHRKAQRQKVKDRAQEYEDPTNILIEKCKVLAEAVMNSNHLVVYTGAGISTAACIPDYRGTNGIWTLLQQGKDIGLHDLSRAEPTLTHMALYCLYRCGVLKHVVSQNCDGLHLRSGIPRTAMSEVHGNMYLEVCMKCKPCNHYLRLFDVTEYTARYSHETLRLCYKCGSPLKDTIVHFGERGKLQWPLNWETACKQADKADVILCLGSSLKVLKKYPWLWCMDKPVRKRPKLYIVNLQWTPKDDHSILKINGKCDVVIKQIMAYMGLNIPKYVRSLDPIFHHATLLHETEIHTTSRSPIEKSPKTSKEVPSTSPKNISDNVKTAEFKSDDYDALICSSSQESFLHIKNRIKTGDDNARMIDLISSTNVVLKDNIDVKKEIASDTNSDKENDIVAITNDIKYKKLTIRENIAVETEKILDDDYQTETINTENSKLPVINEMSVECVVSEIEEINESVDIKIKEESLNLTSLDVSKTNCMKVSCHTTQQPFINNFSALRDSDLHLIFSRNLWSDLSLFDALTHQRIFFNHPALEWSNINTCSSLFPYFMNNQSVFNTYFNYANIIQNSAVISDSSVIECSTSSSVAVEKVLNEETATESVSCSFCFNNYNSQNCLFYLVHDPNTPHDVASVCLCCDGDDEEEDQEEQEEESDKNANKVININPGWFGKGYRKKIKKRK